MTLFYKVVSAINVTASDALWKEWFCFENKIMDVPDLKVSIDVNNHWRYGIEILDGKLERPVLKLNECLLCVNSTWSVANLVSFDGNKQDIYKLFNALLLTHLSTRHAIEMHASLIDISGKGLMFLGPSGIGKTTQAELWMKYRNAEIINGDMVFVKQEEDGFLGCGSPWHGSSPYCLNRQVPLAALVILKQSPENSIRRLTGFEMVSEVMNSVFFPTWYKEGHDAACKTLDALLRTVPVYELSCRPDEEAVRLTEEAVFGGSM